MSTPFRWGILGAANINKRFLAGVREAGHVIAIIGARDLARAQTAAAEWGAERSGGYHDVLHASDVDTIYIPLPNGLHREWTIRAAEAGKHVLCEKPMAPSVADCTAMVAACERNGVHLVEAFMYRYHPQWKVVWDAVNSGKLGKIQTLRATFQFSIRDPANVRLSAPLDGGALQDAGCYCINVCRWFLGEPTRVRGISLDRQGHGVDTHNAAALEFASGAEALLSCSFETTFSQSLELIGDRGRIEVPAPFLPSGDTPVHLVDADGDRIETIAARNQYAEEALAMEALIRDSKASLTPGADAALTQAVIAAWKAT
jgi:D-xylose 1-dehydrogenase (NADP+, D-xylono-1,5-lactone-forming)